MQRQMKTFSLRAILLTTALFVAAPAWAQDQGASKPDTAKADAAKSDTAKATVKTADATPDKKADAAKPIVIDASQDSSKDASKDKSKPVRVAQKDQVPATQDSTEGRSIPGPLRNYEMPVQQNNPGAVQAPPPEAFPEEWIPVPDRWRIVNALGVGGQWWDP